MKAHFYKRIIAFILDIVLISILSMLVSGLLNLKTPTVLLDQYYELPNKYLNNEITTEQLLSQEADLKYNIEYLSISKNIITLVLTVVVFVLVPFYKKGQTPGKRIMNIKIISTNDEDLSMNQLIIRAMINNSLLSSLLLVTAVMIVNANQYMLISRADTTIFSIVFIITVFMILFKKDGRGLHDILSKTQVIKGDN